MWLIAATPLRAGRSASKVKPRSAVPCTTARAVSIESAVTIRISMDGFSALKAKSASGRKCTVRLSRLTMVTLPLTVPLLQSMAPFRCSNSRSVSWTGLRTKRPLSVSRNPPMWRSDSAVPKCASSLPPKAQVASSPSTNEG